MLLEKIDHIFACLDPVDNGTVSFRSEGYRNLMYLQLQCKKNVSQTVDRQRQAH